MFTAKLLLLSLLLGLKCSEFPTRMLIEPRLLPAGEPLRVFLSVLFANDTSICYILQNTQSAHFDLLRAHLAHALVLLQFRNASIKRLHCPGNAYILSVQDLQEFRDFLSTASARESVFKPHARLLITYTGSAQERFSELLGIHALDVIELLLPSTWENCSAVRLSTNETLFAWNISDRSEYFVHATALLRRKWNPQELFQRPGFRFRFYGFDCAPFIMVGADGRVMGGSEVKLALEMVRGFPMEFQMLDSETGNKWGVVQDAVEQGRSDMAGCSQYITNLRQRNVDFTMNQNQICSTFLVPKARRLQDSLFLMQAFSLDVWICCSVAICLLCLLAWRFAFWPAVDVVKLSWSGSVFLLPSTVLRPSKRLYFFSVLLYGFLMASYYNAGLSSSLAVPRLVKNINTLQDVVDYGLTFQEQGGIKEELFFSNSSLFRSLFALYRDESRLTTPLNGNTAVRVKVLENTFVTDLEGFAQDKLKGYKVLKECLGNYYMGFILQKNSPFKLGFDNVAKRLAEAGLTRKWIDELIDLQGKKQEVLFASYLPTIGFNTVTLERLYGGFVLMFTGLVLSGLVFLWELAIFRMKLKKGF